MATLHKPSIFTYSLSRPYPFRWFTPVTIVGFVLFATLFSVLNFFSTGFVQVSQNSSDPNATVAGDGYLNRWPSFIFNMRPSCQPNNMPINSQVFTNQTGLAYTLTGIWQETDEGVAILPSLPYYNNILHNCVLSSAYLDIRGFDQSAAQIAFSKYGVTINSFMTCEVQLESGLTWLNLTQSYNYVPATFHYTKKKQVLETNFLDRDKMGKASLWWAESLLSYYWSFLAQRIQEQQFRVPDTEDWQIRSGAVWFTPSAHAAQRRIDDQAYLDVDWAIVAIKNEDPSTSPVMTPMANGPEFDTENKTLSSQTAQDHRFWPDIWSFADALVKVAYSAIVTDLGQTQSTINIAVDSSLLEDYSGKFKRDFWQPNETYSMITNAQPGPATDDYETLKASTGPLGTTPAVISTQYLCTVPRQKSGGNLFVSILVADIVFLQVLWKLFNLMVGWTALRRVPGSDHCEGCVQQTAPPIDSLAYRRLAESSEPLAADTTGIELHSTKPVFRSTEASIRRSMDAHHPDQEGLLR